MCKDILCFVILLIVATINAYGTTERRGLLLLSRGLDSQYQNQQ